MTAVDLLELRQLLSAVTVQLGASTDNTIYQSSPDVSNGHGEFILAGGGRRGLVQFDVGAIPEGSTVIDAVLRLNVAGMVGGSSAVSVHKVSSAWGESGSNAPGDELTGDVARELDATWLYSLFDGQLWGNAGGDFAGASASTSVGGIGAYEWMGGGLIDDVQSWVDSPTANFGWLLQLAGDSVRMFVSKDGPDTTLAPTLEVTYEGPPAILEGRVWNDVNGDGLKLEPAVADLGLSIVGGNTFFNAFGGDEYWFRSSTNNKWYYLTSDGTLTRWMGPSGQLQGEIVSKIDPRFYYQPSLMSGSSAGDPEAWLDGWTVELLDASGTVIETTQTAGRDINLDGHIDAATEGGWYQFVVTRGQKYSVRQVLPSGWIESTKLTFDTSSPAAQIVNSLNLRFRTSYYQNFGGLGEKWVYSDQKGWHYITPDGLLYRWSGGGVSPLKGKLVATVGTKYFDNPALMFNGQFSSSDVGATDVVNRIDFGNSQAGEVRGRIWLDFYSNGVRDTVDLIPDYFVLFPTDPLAAGHEWFYDYQNNDWYIIDQDGQPAYWGPNVVDGGDDFNRGGSTQVRSFVENETEPWLNGRTVELVDKSGNVVATTVTRSVDLNNDGIIQAESERGWYIFSEVVSGDYTVRVSSENGWVVTAPLTEVQTLAATLDAQYDFKTSISDFLNWGQENERWVISEDNKWFYILPDGQLFEWVVKSGPSSGGLQGVLRGKLNSEYYQNLDLLAEPDTTPVAVQVKGSQTVGDVLFGDHRLLSDLISVL